MPTSEKSVARRVHGIDCSIQVLHASKRIAVSELYRIHDERQIHLVPQLHFAFGYTSQFFRPDRFPVENAPRDWI